jgi:hypothetical protein
MALPRGLTFRPGWHIEDDAYRELKEGWGRDCVARAGAHDLDLLGFLEELLDALGAAPRESLLPNSYLQISAGASEKCKKFVKTHIPQFRKNTF